MTRTNKPQNATAAEREPEATPTAAATERQPDVEPSRQNVPGRTGRAAIHIS